MSQSSETQQLEININRYRLQPSVGPDPNEETLERLDSFKLLVNSEANPNIFEILCFSVKTTESAVWCFTLADDLDVNRQSLYIHRFDRNTKEVRLDQYIPLDTIMLSVGEDENNYTSRSFVMDVFFDSHLIAISQCWLTPHTVTQAMEGPMSLLGIKFQHSGEPALPIPKVVAESALRLKVSPTELTERKDPIFKLQDLRTNWSATFYLTKGRSPRLFHLFLPHHRTLFIHVMRGNRFVPYTRNNGMILLNPFQFCLPTSSETQKLSLYFAELKSSDELKPKYRIKKWVLF